MRRGAAISDGDSIFGPTPGVWCHSLANQWLAAGLRHTKVPVQLSWSLDQGETKKVPETRYQILAVETKKSRVEAS